MIFLSRRNGGKSRNNMMELYNVYYISYHNYM